MKLSNFYWLGSFVFVAPHTEPVVALVIGGVYGAIAAFLQIRGK